MARSRRSWGAIRKLQSGRFQARYPEPRQRGADAGSGDVRDEDGGGSLAGQEADRAGRRHGRGRPDRQPAAEGVVAVVLALSPAQEGAHHGQLRRGVAPPHRASLRLDARSADQARTRRRLDRRHARAGNVCVEGHRVGGRAEARVGPGRSRSERSRPTPALYERRRFPKRPKTERPVLSPAEVEKLASVMRARAGASARAPARLLRPSDRRGARPSNGATSTCSARPSRSVAASRTRLARSSSGRRRPTRRERSRCLTRWSSNSRRR